MFPSLAPLSDTAWIVRWDDDSLETTRQITALAQRAIAAFAEEPIEVVPGLATLTFIGTGLADDDLFRERLAALLQETFAHAADTARLVELPICYDGEFGPDLAEVAQHARIS